MGTMRIDTEQDRIERENIEARIRTLVSRLDAPTSDIGDWKVIKTYEARLRGEEDPYDFAALDAARQAVREEINALQERLAEMDI